MGRLKSNKTLLYAASILAVTLSAFPHVAAASTTTAPLQAGTDMRKAGGTNLIYLQVIVVAGNLMSLP